MAEVNNYASLILKFGHNTRNDIFSFAPNDILLFDKIESGNFQNLLGLVCCPVMLSVDLKTTVIDWLQSTTGKTIEPNYQLCLSEIVLMNGNVVERNIYNIFSARVGKMAGFRDFEAVKAGDFFKKQRDFQPSHYLVIEKNVLVKQDASDAKPKLLEIMVECKGKYPKARIL